MIMHLIKHNSVDDYPYGGGAGMLMQAEPVYLAYEALKEPDRQRESRRRSNSENTPANEEQIEAQQ